MEVVARSAGQEIQEGSLQMLLKEVVLILFPLPSCSSCHQMGNVTSHWGTAAGRDGTSVLKSVLPLGQCCSQACKKYISKWIRSAEVLQRHIACEGNSYKSLGKRLSVTDTIFCGCLWGMWNMKGSRAPGYAGQEPPTKWVQEEIFSVD